VNNVLLVQSSGGGSWRQPQNCLISQMTLAVRKTNDICRPVGIGYSIFDVLDLKMVFIVN